MKKDEVVTSKYTIKITFEEDEDIIGLFFFKDGESVVDLSEIVNSPDSQMIFLDLLRQVYFQGRDDFQEWLIKKFQVS